MLCVLYTHVLQIEMCEQSSTLTTGPKVLASKIGLGLVKICNLEVQWA